MKEMDPQTVAILNSLKGPPGNILLALTSSDRPLGTNELVYLTGWCESSVIAGLQKLELLGWVERLARYNGWALVDQVRRTVIPRIFLSAGSSPVSPLDPLGNCESFTSIPQGESIGDQDLAGNSTDQGSPDHDGSQPSPALDGNRDSRSSAEQPEPAPAHPEQASTASCTSPSPPFSASLGRRYPLHKKPRSSRVRRGSPSEEEDLILKTQNLSSSDSDSAPASENEPPERLDLLLASADVGKILAATRQLFGEPVMGDPARYPDPVLLLAAIAEAYQNRQILRKPARVVFTNLRNETNAVSSAIGLKYFADPCAYLPDSFLQAAGLPRSRIVDQSPAGSNSDSSRYLEGLPDYEFSEQDQSLDSPSLPEPHPSLSHRVGDHPSRTAVDAWTWVKTVLEAQLEKGVYHAYLARAFLARYDSSSNTFTVAVEDPFTRAWLQERSARLVERLLHGICNRPAAVQYVTVDQILE